MQFSSHRFETLFNRLFLVCFSILAIGVPLVFSSLTRSVFEVNKLLLIRIIIIIVYGLWLFKSLVLKDNNLAPKKENSYSLFGLRWKRIGLEIPFALWITGTLISIFLSDNIIVSTIGSYDRWEGIGTTLNYILLFYMVAKLIDNNRYRLIIFCLMLFATSISSIYGIMQSLGIDFMNWSVSPTARVFACINNPVHYCAYVAMTVPLGLSLTQYLLPENSIEAPKKLLTPTKIVTFLGSTALFLTLSFELFSLEFFQFIVLFALGSFILNTYHGLLPTKQTAQYALWYSGLILLSLISKTFLLNPSQTYSLIAALLIYYCVSAVHDKKLLLYRVCMVTTLLVFYSMFLSYSRATLVGFSVAISTYFQFIHNSKNENFSMKKGALLLISNFILNFIFIFKLHTFNTTISAIQIVILVLLCGSYLYTSNLINKGNIQKEKLLYNGLFFAILCLPFLGILENYILGFGLITLISTQLFKDQLSPIFAKNTLHCFIFLTLSFYFSSASYILLFIIYLICLNYISLKQLLSKENIFHFSCLISCMALFVFVPISTLVFTDLQTAYLDIFSTQNLINYGLFCGSLALLYIRFYDKKQLLTGALLIIICAGIPALSPIAKERYLVSANKESLHVAKNISHKMTKLADHSKRNPRLFMWLSVPAWLLDHPFFGSGPDTIRHYYPEYRHPKYGPAEGGHNFTPDRLHNEYFNTLVSTGLVNTFIKYILIFGGWYLILFTLLKKHFNDKKRYILVGIICSPTIYSIQVLFNFGVVATLFLFYFLMGLGLSFVNDETQTDN